MKMNSLKHTFTITLVLLMICAVFSISAFASDGIAELQKENLSMASEEAAQIIPAKLQGIKLKQPAKTTYIEGEILDLSGLTVVAQYDVGDSKIITGWKSNPLSGTVLKTADKTVSIRYTENGVTKVANFSIMVSPPETRPLWVRVKTTTIAETLACYLNITATGDDIAGEKLTAYFKMGKKLLYPTPIRNSFGCMFIENAPEAGWYEIVVKNDLGTIQGSRTIEVVEYNEDIWVMNTTINEDGFVVLLFNESISAKDGIFDKEATLNGKAIACALGLDKMSLVTDVKYEELSAGKHIFSVGEVKYPKISPSYVYTFRAKVVILEKETDSKATARNPVVSKSAQQK